MAVMLVWDHWIQSSAAAQGQRLARQVWLDTPILLDLDAPDDDAVLDPLVGCASAHRILSTKETKP